VRANLTRFIELALEVDSGRYPTLPRFLDRVRQLRNLDKEGPSQATPESESGQRVRLLTIHASKGLEASVVFLVDSTNEGAGAPGCQTLVRWPAEADRPSDFMLLAKTRQRDSISRARYELDRQEEQRESVNLLYVAMTRARHMLVVSGCARSSRNRKQSLGWYGQIARALFDDELPQEIWTHTFGQATGTGSGQAPKQEAVDVDPRLRGPIPARKLWREIAPSRAQEDTGLDRGEKLGRLRGLAIHRMLQLASCSTGSSAEAEQIIQSVAAEFQRSPDDTILKSWWKETVTVLENRDLAWLFEPAESEKAYNEVPIQYRHHDEIISGVIDRLLVSDTAIYLVDYKTHRITDKSLEKRLAEYYAPQMRLYGEGVQRLWPSLPLKSYLLLTDIAKLVEIA
jgi:ATP-dependent helicase/nuclease subunit A